METTANEFPETLEAIARAATLAAITVRAANDRNARTSDDDEEGCLRISYSSLRLTRGLNALEQAFKAFVRGDLRSARAAITESEALMRNALAY